MVAKIQKYRDIFGPNDRKSEELIVTLHETNRYQSFNFHKLAMKNLFIFPMIVFSLVLMLPLNATAAPRTQGDVNSDGIVNISDVTSLIDLLLNNDTSFIDAQTDVDGDGALTIADVTTLIDMLLGNVPQDDTVTIEVNGVSFVMVPVQGGTFMMGATNEETYFARRNEFPVHEVTLSGYYIGQTEVTWEQWFAVTGYDIASFDGDLHSPAVNLSWFDCAKFVDKLSELTGKQFRMPTEAEWEYAARGGSGGIRYRYAGSNDVDAVAWYLENADGRIHTVATKAPNSLGIYDMTGNALEWCQDFYGSYDGNSQVNPTGPESGYSNVVRGGAWDVSYLCCHVTYRNSYNPQEHTDDLGLRIAMNMQ